MVDIRFKVQTATPGAEVDSVEVVADMDAEVVVKVAIKEEEEEETEDSIARDSRQQLIR